MKKSFLLLTISISSNLLSQIGVGTNNPQGVFHVDPMNNNPISETPTTALQVDDITVSPIGNLGIGNISPSAKIEITDGTSSNPPLKINDMISANTGSQVTPLGIDANGVVVKQFSPATLAGSYSVDNTYLVTANNSVPTFTNVGSGTIVTFEFCTNFAFGSGDTSMLFGRISYSIATGFRIADEWTYSGNGISTYTVTGIGTSTLTFNSTTAPNLTFSYANNAINVGKTNGGANTTANIYIFNGKKIRN